MLTLSLALAVTKAATDRDQHTGSSSSSFFFWFFSVRCYYYYYLVRLVDKRFQDEFGLTAVD
jgi:hypothetical protein